MFRAGCRRSTARLKVKNSSPLTKFIATVSGIALFISLAMLYAPKISAVIVHNTGALQVDSANHEIQSPCGYSLIDNTANAKAITTLALTSNVVTVTTAAHSYVVGQQVTIALLTGPTLFADCNGSFIIATVPGGTTFTYALTHANIGSGAATGTTTAYMCSPMPTATTTIALVFPPKAIHLTVLPTAAGDAVLSKTSTGIITQTGTYTNGGNFLLAQNVATGINGVEGDTVYVIRTTTTPIHFAFDLLR